MEASGKVSVAAEGPSSCSQLQSGPGVKQVAKLEDLVFKGVGGDPKCDARPSVP